MFRYLLVFLAVLVAVLAVLFERLWLYVVAGVFLVSGLGLLGWRYWTSSQDEEKERPSPQPEPSDESLEDLGIVDIRPQDAEGPRSAAPEPDQEDERRGGEQRTSPSASTSESRAATEQPDAGPTTNQEDAAIESAASSVVPDEAPVLGPFVQSLRAALDANTVALLVQEEIALTYRIEALASAHSRVRESGTFDAQTPLLAAHMSRQSVSIRPLTEDEIAVEDLGYYKDPPDVDHLAVAPVPRPDEPTTTFLIADAAVGSDLGSARARALLEHFAETAALLLKTPETPAEATGEEADDHADAGAPESSIPDDESDETPRPRREIIAEEMEAAEAASEDLALILVHLNRAESIARRGDEAVATAERLLQTRLEQFAASQRVERFGELTYGIFFRGGVEAVEPWVADLEATMDQEEGELEGGVSVGVAVQGEHHDGPEALRGDATEALREAYKTGTSTVVT